MSKKKASYRALRQEAVVSGDFSRTLVPGETYDDLPDSIIEAFTGEYGALEEVADE